MRVSTALLAILMLVGCTTYVSPNDVPRQIIGLHQRVPYELVGDPLCPTPTVEVEINGVKGRFLVDTGCPQSCMTPDFCRRAHLSTQAANQEGTVQQAYVSELRVGPVVFKDFYIFCDELKVGVTHVDGFLGATLLLADTFTIDSRDRFIVWGDAGCGEPIKIAVQGGYGFFLAHFRATVLARINGYVTPLIIDTGSSVTHINRNMYLRQRDQGAPEWRHFTRAQDKPLQIEHPHETVTIREIDYLPALEIALGAFHQDTFEGRSFLVNVIFADPDGEPEVLGFNVLSQCVVTIDAQNEKLYLASLPVADTQPGHQ
ncbi:MAG: retroviral-like aspartic protease family protein [Phycisphaerales bacterium]|nr:retroviral-like aspartic protease family protein [Phycisphaerales bacterium]